MSSHRAATENPVEHMSVDTYDKVLNAAQQSVVDAIEGDIAGRP